MNIYEGSTDLGSDDFDLCILALFAYLKLFIYSHVVFRMTPQHCFVLVARRSSLAVGQLRTADG